MNLRPPKLSQRFREDKRSPNTFLQQLHLEVKAYFVAPRAAFAPPIAAIGGRRSGLRAISLGWQLYLGESRIKPCF
ncbi:hypothetical protein Y032_0005g2614 [Ancylostoma ceylanicum]|uniref:Uncharacterized protein n=1 Tax=Ancylostoma ceylanicum TaxID=53326 RepID=A0A016VSH8_9BILA|nr:hypothetical protein Y032_0005g2614 [Ancylostoma ceylanicum]